MNKGRLRRALLLACAISTVVCAACATYLSRGGDTIRFSHAVHKKAEVECLTCHEPIYDAKVLRGDFLPKEATCLRCHEEKKVKGECGFCHSDARRAGPFRRQEPSLKMGHAGHIERVKEDCGRCHATLPEPGRKAEPPTMASCLGCHEHKQEYREGKCLGCHRDLSRYPLQPVSVFSHQGDYVRVHGRAARSAPDVCGTCHEQTFCADCHASTVAVKVEFKLPERQDANYIHRDDYLGRHGIEAQGDSASCRRCHGTSFCESCHTAQNLTRRGDNPRNPHPPGWMVAGPRSHGEAARRDIASCASCHDQGPKSNCVDCHRVGGVGGNPHPMSWLEKHDREEIQRNGMCLYCHNN